MSTFCQRKKICQSAQNRKRTRIQKKKNDAPASQRMIEGKKINKGKIRNKARATPTHHYAWPENHQTSTHQAEFGNEHKHQKGRNM